MRTLIAAVGALLATVALLGAGGAQEGLPPGHAPVRQPQPGQQEIEIGPRPDPLPEDVESVDAIIDAYYASLSAAPGEKRNWDRFLSLFASDSRLLVTRPTALRVELGFMDPEVFAKAQDRYLTVQGLYEKSLYRKVERFGPMAHVWSTFASRRTEQDDEPYARGMYSFQLFNDGKRWYIIGVMWTFENPANPLPPEYLPEDGGQ